MNKQSIKNIAALTDRIVAVGLGVVMIYTIIYFFNNIVPIL